MPALEPLRGTRVVADAAAIDAARWLGGDVQVLRWAPDEAFALDATGVDVDDPHAVVETEVGFVGVWVDPDQIAWDHLEWPIPALRQGMVLQGAVAGVPAKVWWPDDAPRALIVTHAAYADELTDRLGWDR